MGYIQQLIEAAQSQPGYTVILGSSLVALAIGVIQVVVKVIRRKTITVIEGDPVVLLVAGSMAVAALLRQDYLPLAFGLIPIALCALFVAKGDRNRSIAEVYPRIKFPNWLISRSVQVTAALVAIPVFLLAVIGSSIWAWNEWRMELRRFATVSVTFVLPSQLEVVPRNADTARIYSEEIFKDLREDMVQVFSTLAEKIVVLPTAEYLPTAGYLPTAEYKYATLVKTFPNGLAMSELPKRIKRFHDDQHRVPVKLAVHNTFRNADADFDALTVTTEIVLFDWETEREQVQDGPIIFRGRSDDLHRISLLATYRVVRFFLLGHDGITRTSEDKKAIRTSMYTAFQRFHESDVFKEKRSNPAALEKAFKCTNDCATDERLQWLAIEYGKALKDEKGQMRVDTEISELSARLKSSKR